MKILEVLVRVTELLYFLHSSDCLPSEVTPSLRCLVVRLQHGTRRSTARRRVSWTVHCSSRTRRESSGARQWNCPSYISRTAALLISPLREAPRHWNLPLTDTLYLLAQKEGISARAVLPRSMYTSPLLIDLSSSAGRPPPMVHLDFHSTRPFLPPHNEQWIPPSRAEPLASESPHPHPDTTPKSEIHQPVRHNRVFHPLPPVFDATTRRQTTKSCEISNVTANQKTCNGAWGYHDGRALQAWKNQTGRAPGPNKRCKALRAPWTLQVPKQLTAHQAHCTRHVLP